MVRLGVAEIPSRIGSVAAIALHRRHFADSLAVPQIYSVFI
jgi:hypothetical protein